MDCVKMAFESIWDKKIRSLLTMLGIIIGVGSVLILVSVVQGYNADLTAYYEKLGVNKVQVSIESYDRTNTTDQSGEFMEWVNESLSDVVTGVTPSYSTSGTLKYYGNTTDTTQVYFGNEQWSICNNYTLDEGRDLTALDISGEVGSVSLLFNSSGQVVGFIPQEGGYEDVTIGTATASELTDKSGSSIRISGDTVVVAGGTSYPYTTTGYQ